MVAAGMLNRQEGELLKAARAESMVNFLAALYVPSFASGELNKLSAPVSPKKSIGSRQTEVVRANAEEAISNGSQVVPARQSAVQSADARTQNALNNAALAELTGVTSPIDFAHVMGADFNRRGPTGGHTLLMNDVRVTSIHAPPLANGVYEAAIEARNSAGAWIPKTTNGSINTMFPAEWTEARTIVELDGAWKSPRKITTADTWTSTTPSGVPVEGYLRPRVTAYPLYRP